MPTVRVNEINLFYEFHGNPDGPTIVFVNGLLTDTASWSGHLPYFTEKYRCLVWDCRGQGQSDKPNHIYETRFHSDDLAALVEALGIEHAHFVGLSNGGAAVLSYAADHPERASSVAAAGAYAHVDTIEKVKLTSWVRAMEAGGSPLRFDVAVPWVWGGGYLDKNYEGLLYFREKGANMHTEWATNLIKGAMVHDIRDKLPLIQAPVLVVVGEDDVLTPPKLSRYIAERIPRSELVVMPDLGHAVALEDVEGFSNTLLGFFERLEKGE